nr:MAG TPA: hypothetical protein [Caudoviricetes sp.]
MEMLKLKICLEHILWILSRSITIYLLSMYLPCK